VRLSDLGDEKCIRKSDSSTNEVRIKDYEIYARTGQEEEGGDEEGEKQEEMNNGRIEEN